MYFDYLKEREPGVHVVQKEHGFAMFTVVTFKEAKAVYIQDIYVKPEYRNSNLASNISEEIQAWAKSEGINTMVGSVVPSTEGSHASLKVLLAHGMTLDSAGQDIIWFYKEIT